MADICLAKHHRNLGHFLPGLILTALIAAAAIWLGRLP
ncbi:hypothetical protein SAMN05216516_105146 [Izhakiella capsodis]|uniref:Uncharacterized protein n=1 Tax=Izhakiella capsodis TaxID=1367852 RepID=A0A1I4Y1L8_9GAMM|nr:hypothetical protein SAMN05216516_105146 [Izhakiella capsodis]